MGVLYCGSTIKYCTVGVLYCGSIIKVGVLYCKSIVLYCKYTVHKNILLHLATVEFLKHSVIRTTLTPVEVGVCIASYPGPRRSGWSLGTRLVYVLACQRWL